MTTKQKNEVKELILSLSKKISELPAATEYNDSDYIAIVQQEESVNYSKKTSLAELTSFIKNGLSTDGACFLGIASPQDASVVLPTGNDGFWFAIEDGTYTQYGNVTVTDIPKLLYYNHTTETWTNADLWVSKGPKGDTGATGATGPQGPQGPAGPGVPAGGSAGQVLAKSSGSDYATEWITPSGGGGTGSVTSVGMTVPTGLSVSGSPITSSGTLAVSYVDGYSIPTTAKQTMWDGKQDALVSGTNIKTINNQSILGGGNITISGGGGGTMNYQKVTQVEYDAMYTAGTLSDSVLYVIVD